MNAVMARNTFPSIIEHFEAYKAPAIFINGLKIYRAKVGSANPMGTLYVVSKAGGMNQWGESTRTYYGKIMPDGTYRPTTDGEYWGVTETLEAVEDGGMEYLARVGRETGICCFCAALLEDPESVRRGYGPVCARNNGLPHGNRHGF